MTKPEEGGVWGAGVQMCMYHERALLLPTASFLLCQLFNLHQFPGLSLTLPLTHVIEATTLKSLWVDVVTEARWHGKEHSLWSLTNMN